MPCRSPPSATGRPRAAAGSISHPGHRTWSTSWSPAPASRSTTARTPRARGRWHRGPHTFVTRGPRPVQDRPRCLGRVPLAPAPAEQLVGELGLALRGRPALDEPAVADDVPGSLAFDRQQPDRGWRGGGTDPVLDVRHRGAPMDVDPPAGRHPRITFGPQLTLDGGLGHSPGPEQEAIRLEHDRGPRGRLIYHDSNPLTTCALRAAVLTRRRTPRGRPATLGLDTVAARPTRPTKPRAPRVLDRRRAIPRRSGRRRRARGG
jgi:hypothetical protein